MTLLGAPIAFPVLVAPTAFQCMADPEGEVATVRAAGATGTVMVLSTLSNRSIEEVTVDPDWDEFIRSADQIT